ncbi:MAG: hypothetical protein ACRD12_08345 [Acidimicrobiales bacterium]
MSEVGRLIRERLRQALERDERTNAAVAVNVDEPGVVTAAYSEDSEAAEPDRRDD